MTTVLIRKFEGAAFVDVAAAARLLSISERHFKALVARGDLPRPTKFGRSARWSVVRLLEAAGDHELDQGAGANGRPRPFGGREDCRKDQIDTAPPGMVRFTDHESGDERGARGSMAGMGQMADEEN